MSNMWRVLFQQSLILTTKFLQETNSKDKQKSDKIRFYNGNYNRREANKRKNNDSKPSCKTCKLKGKAILFQVTSIME